MILFLVKHFVKDYDQVTLPKVRQEYGVVSGILGIVLNLFLVITKLFAAFISSSVSILADALNNLSDAASSVVTLVGFWLSGQEADEEHPFGHGRIEYVAGLIVSLFIIITGVELVQSSIKKIIYPEEIYFNSIVLIILLISMFVKLVMFQENLQASKAVDSAALKSTAMDSISDVFVTSVVLLSSVISHFTGVNIDGFAGAFVGVCIIKTGFEAAGDTISPLLGEPPSKEFVDEVNKTVLSHEHILGVHDLIVHNYGPGRIIMSLHVEVPAEMNIITIHDIIDNIEDELRQKYHCTAVIHMDPVVQNDASVAGFKRDVRHILDELDDSFTFHDLRMISYADGTKKITFDIVVPYKYPMKDEEIIDFIRNRLNLSAPDYTYEITIDKG